MILMGQSARLDGVVVTRSDLDMKIVVVGASVRAAAGSLLRAGCQPIAFDLFADTDLMAGTVASRLDPVDYPARIGVRVGHLAPLPFLYTGAIENSPEVVADLMSRRFRLLGNGPAVLQAVRDPVQFAAALRRAGLLAPATEVDPRHVPTDGSWLVKPVRSGGGEGIRRWLGGEYPPGAPVLFQERVMGRSCSAIFNAGPGGVEYIGATRQYHGRTGNPFAYQASLGPWRFRKAVEVLVAALGRTIGESFGLVGVFGIDLIVANDRVWAIEVNPRYTASVEVLEQGLGRAVLADHLRACGVEPPAAGPIRRTSRFVAKEVLFARHSARFTGRLTSCQGLDQFPEVADIPAPGTLLERGQPVLTVFGRGATPAACRRDLARRVRRWEGRLHRLNPGSDPAVHQEQQRHCHEQNQKDHPGKPDRLNGNLPGGLDP